MTGPTSEPWFAQPTQAVEERLRSTSIDATERRALTILLADRLTGELLADLDGRQPQPNPNPNPNPSPTGPTAQRMPAAGWHPDPMGRFRVRWWDGERWTDWASNAGPAVRDPL